MRARPLAEPLIARSATRRRSGLRCIVLLAVAFCVLGCVLASDSNGKDERERNNFSYIHKDLRRPQQYGMSTLADYPQLLADDDDGQIMKTPETTEVPLDLPTIVLSDILPSTGFLVARDKFTNTILSNSTAFFVASDVVITAAHSVAPLLRRFHVNLQIITNSRTSGGSRTFNVTSIAYDNVNAPCQVLLQVRTVSNFFSPHKPVLCLKLYITIANPISFAQVNGNHSHTLPLSKHPAEDGSMVRVLSNSPIGFGGIHLDGTFIQNVYYLIASQYDPLTHTHRLISRFQISLMTHLLHAP